jgi:hypothetical protein
LPLCAAAASAKSGLSGIIIVRFFGKNESGRAKPRGMYGIELRWIIADRLPANWSELFHCEFVAHSPLRLSFEGQDRGKPRDLSLFNFFSFLPDFGSELSCFFHKCVPLQNHIIASTKICASNTLKNMVTG